MSTFEAFNLPSPLLSALKALKYETPTPIQQKSIPDALAGKDLIGIAQTGTGKTAAFGIPLIVALQQNPKAYALILAPTRELALQIEGVLVKLTKGTPHMRITCLIGGASMIRQMHELRRHPRILVATPGRLLDHMSQGNVTLRNVHFLVLDEADRMLDIGFEPQLRDIFKEVPRQRQTLLYSATFPHRIAKLAERYMTTPVKVTVGQVAQPVAKIRQSFVRTTQQGKNTVLMQELKQRQGSVLIFTRTKHRTDRLTKFLSDAGLKAERIHGNRTQAQRNRAIEDFRNRRFRILVATDIASRGLDIPHIAHVINYDLPQVAEDYIHRIGRTARAGAEGESLCLLTPEEGKLWKELERELIRHKTPIQILTPATSALENKRRAS